MLFWSCQLASFQHGGNFWSPFIVLKDAGGASCGRTLGKSYRNGAGLSFPVQRKQRAWTWFTWADTICGHWSPILVSLWWKVKVQLKSPTAAMQNYIPDKFSLTLNCSQSLHILCNGLGWEFWFCFFFYFSLFFSLHLDLQPKATASCSWFFQCW